MLAAKGKRKKPGATAFLANFEGEILRLERELVSQTYQPGRYVMTEIHDSKRRLVSATASCITPSAPRSSPIFERGVIGNSFANRTGKCSHRAIAAYERYRDRHAHVLLCDIYRYFLAIDHHLAEGCVPAARACAPILWLPDSKVDGPNRQEPGDRSFSALRARHGAGRRSATYPTFEYQLRVRVIFLAKP